MHKVDLADPTQIFDVSLSFAGEDRKFVCEVAKQLVERGQLVFYDYFYQPGLIGKELVTFLRNLYAERSRYCAIFVSKNYSLKRWPNIVERQSILDRATREDDDYLIPIVLDSSWLEGLPSTTGYIDAQKLSSSEVARIITDKLGVKSLDKDETKLFWSLMNVPAIFGSFLVIFREKSKILRGRYGGWRTWLEVLRMDGQKLETYGLCTCEWSEDDFEPWVEIILTERGKRFRDYLRNHLFIPHTEPFEGNKISG